MAKLSFRGIPRDHVQIPEETVGLIVKGFGRAADTSFSLQRGWGCGPTTV